MQRLQIHLIWIYLLMTLLLVGFGLLFPSNENLWVFRYLSILSLFIISFFIKIKERNQTPLPYALFFAVIGDTFLYLPIALKFIKLNLPLGLLSFTIAYGIISSTYARILWRLIKPKDRLLYLKQIALLLLIVSVFIYALRKLTLDNLIFGSLFIFALLLVFISAINLFFSTLISIGLRALIMISSTLMLICDVGVILGFTLPSLDPILYNIGTSIVWSAYIPAWTILCMISMDREFNNIIKPGLSVKR